MSTPKGMWSMASTITKNICKCHHLEEQILQRTCVSPGMIPMNTTTKTYGSQLKLGTLTSMHAAPQLTSTASGVHGRWMCELWGANTIAKTVRAAKLGSCVCDPHHHHNNINNGKGEGKKRIKNFLSDGTRAIVQCVGCFLAPTLESFWRKSVLP